MCSKVIVCEVYSPELPHNYMAYEGVASAADLENFLTGLPLSDTPLFDMYIDIQDEDDPFWQETHALIGIMTKREALCFAMRVWDFTAAFLR